MFPNADEKTLDRLTKSADKAHYDSSKRKLVFRDGKIDKSGERKAAYSRSELHLLTSNAILLLCRVHYSLPQHAAPATRQLKPLQQQKCLWLWPGMLRVQEYEGFLLQENRDWLVPLLVCCVVCIVCFEMSPRFYFFVLICVACRTSGSA